MEYKKPVLFYYESKIRNKKEFNVLNNFLG